MSPPSDPGVEERLRSLVEGHPDGVYELDLQGRFVTGNDALVAMTGYPLEELLGRTPRRMIHPDDIERVATEFARVLKGETRHFEATGVRRNGEHVHVGITNVPMIVNGEVVGVYAIARDITDVRTAQAMLDASEFQFEQMFESAGFGIFILREDGQCVQANPAFLATLGYTADEISRLDLRSTVHPDDADRVAGALDDVLSGHRPSMTLEHRCLTKSRTIVWIRSTHTRLPGDEGRGRHVLCTAEDITERRLTTERLDRSRSMLRMAGSIARFGGWEYDLVADDLQYSDEVSRILEIADPTAVTADEVMDLLPDDAAAELVEAATACVRLGTPFDLELQIRTATGRPIWVRAIGEAERDGAGQIVRLHGAVQDISQRKLAEVESRELADRLITTFETITDAVMLLGRDWRFTYVNDRAVELLRRDRLALLGRVLWEEFPEIDGTEAAQAYRRAMEHGTTERLDEFYYPPFAAWFEINVYPSPDGLTIYFRDVSSQRQAREDLRHQAALLDKASDAIIVRDLEQRATYWNHSAELLYGWSAAEALGHVLPSEDSALSEDRAAAQAAVRRDGGWAGELVERDRHGNEHLVEARWTLVADDEGAPAAILEINTDVTDRRRMEQQIQRAQRLDSLGTFASGIAHDLNNTLAPILMASQLLLGDERNDQRRELLTTIEEGAQHSAAMVQQVLWFARGVDGRRVPVTLSRTVDAVARMIRETFPLGIELHHEPADDLWPVLGDSTQLYQVLVNLCTNARDAMPDGGRITISLANTVVDDAFVATASQRVLPGPYVRMTVSDTGTGMGPEVLDRALEPFFTTKESGHGTGLGLSTSLAIVQSHGGFMTVESAPARGTTWHLYLPTHLHPDEHPDPSPSDDDSAVASSPVVLVVDDENAVRTVVAQTLQRSGYRTQTAADGQQALALLRDHRVDLLITDMVMPTTDGAELIELARQDHRDLPIVAMSGLRTGRDLAESVDEPLFLAKPYTTAKLLEVVARALGEDTPA